MKPSYEIKPVIFYDYYLKENFSGIIELINGSTYFINPRTEEEKECGDYLTIKIIGCQLIEDDDISVKLFKNGNRCFDSLDLMLIFEKIKHLCMLRSKNEKQLIHFYPDGNIPKELSEYMYYESHGIYLSDLNYLIDIENYIENYKDHQNEFKLYKISTELVKSSIYKFCATTSIDRAIIMKDTNIYSTYDKNDGYSYFYSDLEKNELRKIFINDYYPIEIYMKKDSEKTFEFIEVDYHQLIKDYVYKIFDNFKCLILKEDEEKVNKIFKENNIVKTQTVDGKSILSRDLRNKPQEDWVKID